MFAKILDAIKKFIQSTFVPEAISASDAIPEKKLIPSIPIQKPMEKTPSEKIYEIAKENIGNHLTLDPSIPAEVGCAEAVSAIIKKTGIEIVSSGIPGTASLLQWLQSNPIFQETEIYLKGAIILSATGSGNGKIPGHTGICGDFGIMSNDSNNGLFLELWNIDKWKKYYEIYGGMKTHFFVLK